MNVVFRADASLDIGTGHVMRCLTLADMLRAHGARCRFVSRAHPGNLLEAIRARGYEATPLGAASGALTPADCEAPPHAHWLGASMDDDATATAAAFGERAVDWLIVDHYALDARWERRLHARAAHVLAIDDLADRPHDCDVLLDQNLGRKAADYAALVPPGCRILAGPRYALLRPEFARLRSRSLERPLQAPPVHVLVALGGVDRDNVTTTVLDALAAFPLPHEARITVLMGPQAPWLAQVRARASAMPRPTEVVAGANNVAELMAQSDLAIGAAGTSAWERCCLGLPTLTIVLAENQRPGARALERAGATLLVGDNMPLRDDLPQKLRQLGEPGVLAGLRGACAAITDGAGAARVVQEIEHVHA